MSGKTDNRGIIRILWSAATLSTILFLTISSSQAGADDPSSLVWIGNLIINEDIIIQEGQTLIIEPGSNIIFDANASIVVEGTLLARGTPSRPIVIDGSLHHQAQNKSDPSSPYIMVPGSSITFLDGSSSQSVVDHAIISSMALVMDGSSMRFSNCTFLDNSRMMVTGPSTPTIADNQFINNGVGEPSLPWYRVPYDDWRQSIWYGSTLTLRDGTEATIQNNTFFRNGGFGLEVENARPLIIGNTFETNRLGGIRAEMSVNDEVQLLVQGNTISNHGIFQDGMPIVQNPSVPLQGPVGIYLLNVSARLTDNRFVDNEVGIVCIVGDGEGPELHNEDLDGNNVGIYTNSGSLRVYDSSLVSWGYDIWVADIIPVQLVNTSLDDGKVLVEGDEAPDTIPDPGFPMIGLVVLISLAATIGAGATEVGKKGLFAAAYPLYAKARKEKVLDHFLRGQIYGLVRGRPGIHYSRIKRTLEIGNGVLAYHLSVLEKEGFIRPKRLGTRLLYYPTKLPFALQDVEKRFPLGEEPVAGIALSEVQERIVALISENPGISQTDIAKMLKMSKQRISYQIKSLVLSEVITVVWDANRTRCYPRDWDPEDEVPKRTTALEEV